MRIYFKIFIFFLKNTYSFIVLNVIMWNVKCKMRESFIIFDMDNEEILIVNNFFTGNLIIQYYFFLNIHY